MASNLCLILGGAAQQMLEVKLNCSMRRYGIKEA